MCGFVGFINNNNNTNQEMVSEIEKMSITLHHRGPDSYGKWINNVQGIALAHRRLSIQDLSQLGHQPMHSKSNRFTIVFNGEIYNFLELRVDLQNAGHVFRGNSDTEVMLACFEEWGINNSLQKFTGMFAFALWDNKEKILTLARDRFGEKPLYYGWQGNTFLFGSEIKALRKHSDWINEINRDAITLLLRHNYIPAPYSIFKGILKLLPSTYLTFNTNTSSITSNDYWSLRSAFEKGMENPCKDKPEEIILNLEDKITRSIKNQIIADVPVGAFLSGGIDSSTIVALMQSVSEKPVKTFTIGFNEQEYNEAEYAKQISGLLGTDHTELYVTSEDSLSIIPELPYIYDEPFADSSQIPTYLISKLARTKVTVSLSGDSGDELFCGYPRYFSTSRRWAKLNKYPEFVRAISANVIGTLPESLLDKLSRPLITIFTDRNTDYAGEVIHQRVKSWKNKTLQTYYQDRITYWKTDKIVYGGKEPQYALNNPDSDLINLSDLKRLQYLDMQSYLPDDILVKVDRAAMANSLETRIPLLDHEIVEYAASLLPEVNILHNRGKWPLREILYKYVPKELVERPKMGFAVPISNWLKEPLKDWAETLLDRNLLDSEGIFNTDMVRKKWNAHINNKRDYSFELWGVLSYQAWRQYWK